jgi:XTP/dITP diphosphohydrolase
MTEPWSHTLVVATHNRGKLRELRALLAGLPIEVRAMDEVLPEELHVIEDGATFAENALKKANAVAAATMMLTLADDSGLEVDALDGRPGVYSARFAHERATDAENNVALLAALDALRTPSDLRARFRCVLAVVDPYQDGGRPLVVEGTCEGTITRTPRGSGGFGYDPLFVVEGTDRTLAEHSDEEKNAISHRARALAALRPALEELLRRRDETIGRVSRG